MLPETKHRHNLLCFMDSIRCIQLLELPFHSLILAGCSGDDGFTIIQQSE